MSTDATQALADRLDIDLTGQAWRGHVEDLVETVVTAVVAPLLAAVPPGTDPEDDSNWWGGYLAALLDVKREAP